MIEEKELRIRLLTVVTEAGNRREAAHIAGISEDMLRRYLNTDSKLALSPVAKLCEATNTSMNWLLFGAGPKELGETQAQPVDDNQFQALTQMLNESEGYRPPAALTALILELVSSFNMKPEGAKRIIEVMEMIESG